MTQDQIQPSQREIKSEGGILEIRLTHPPPNNDWRYSTKVIADIPKVTVLLATFNGVRFLEEQLFSLKAQEDVFVEVHVNDDGSSDGTMKILKKWKENGLITSITQSNGVGATRAFLRLLLDCEQKPFVAFCDQDDVWEPNKLATQIKLCTESIPTLVFSRRRYCDALGKAIDTSPKLERDPSFGNALIENIVPGNTVLLNSASIKLINSYISPDIAHYDSWMYLLISAFGACKYIEEPLVRYRIHENNQVGLRKFRFSRFESSALNFIYQAAYLSEVSEHVFCEKDRMKLANFISILQAKGMTRKAKAILNSKFERQGLIDQIGFKAIFLVLVCKGKI